MKLKNIATGGRGLGVVGQDPITWAPGEIKDVDPAVIAKAKEDPANAALLADGGDLVEVAVKTKVKVEDVPPAPVADEAKPVKGNAR